MSANRENHGQVFEIGILARLTWNLHSLNNEGTIGNVSEPRTVVLWDGQRSDGVSGEMIKHIHAYWSWLQAFQDSKYHLCDGCRDFRPQRADLISSRLKKNDNVTALDEALRCTLCDLHGFLVQSPTIHRQSVVEFGWVVGIPARVHRDLHTHARHAAAERGVDDSSASREAGGNSSASADTTVAAQMVYHRPTRSGVYAFVSLFQPWRIGLNEVSYSYPVEKEQRKERYALALRAYEWALKRPDGAMRSTRFPHIERAEGLIVISSRPVPVPLLSPLRDDYRDKLRELASLQECEVIEFTDLDEMARVLNALENREPFALARSNAS